jgi:hypothetical protein
MFHHGLGPSWLIIAVVAVIPFWRLCTRVGFSPWLSLLILVPLVNLGFVYYLAFSEWPLPKPTAAPGATTQAPT